MLKHLLEHARSVNGHIVIAFLSLSIGIAVLELVAYVWIRDMVAISAIHESFSDLKEVQLQLKSAANEFILREKANENFFKTGRSIYLERYAAKQNELESMSKQIALKGQAMNCINEAELVSLNAAAEAYDQLFSEMTNTIKARGYGKFGLIGEFDKSIKALLQYNNIRDQTSLVNLQLFVKDYLLTGDKELVNNISNEVFNFTMALESQIRDDQVEEVSEILMNYEMIFNQLTVIDEQLGIYTGNGLQKKLFRASDDLDNAVMLSDTNEQIKSAYQSIVKKILISFFLLVGASVVLGALISRKLYLRLVVPIKTMKGIISSMSRGEVPDQKLIFKATDLQEMGLALNDLLAGTRAYRDFATQIGRGNFDVSYTPLSDKDILGHSLLSMRDGLNENLKQSRMRAWSAQGLSEVSRMLRENSGESELLSAVLRHIVKYLGANQGGLYLTESGAHPDDVYLSLVACYAWNKRKELERKIPLGNGMIGQAAMDREIVYMTNLPPDYIHITSGLGDALPRTSLIVPLVSEMNTIGVIEIASFNRLTNEEIEFVKKCADVIASVVRTLQVNERTRALLADAQDESRRLREEIFSLKELMRVGQTDTQLAPRA